MGVETQQIYMVLTMLSLYSHHALTLSFTLNRTTWCSRIVNARCVILSSVVPDLTVPWSRCLDPHKVSASKPDACSFNSVPRLHSDFEGVLDSTRRKRLSRAFLSFCNFLRPLMSFKRCLPEMLEVPMLTARFNKSLRSS